jgi:hypothetical protein
VMIIHLLECVWHSCFCCSPRKEIVWRIISYWLCVDRNWTASCYACGCYSKIKTCHSYGQFAHTQVKNHHSKNCIKTITIWITCAFQGLRIYLIPRKAEHC